MPATRLVASRCWQPFTTHRPAVTSRPLDVANTSRNATSNFIIEVADHKSRTSTGIDMATTELMEAKETTRDGVRRGLEKPQNGLAGLKHWRYDLRSGFMVALISLPFSMGIAITSGAPPVCGIVSAIIAGFLLPFLGGSYVTISGPAAGLAPVLFAGMITLGGGDLKIGYPRVLAAIFDRRWVAVGPVENACGPPERHIPGRGHRGHAGGDRHADYRQADPTVLRPPFRGPRVLGDPAGSAFAVRPL